MFNCSTNCLCHIGLLHLTSVPPSWGLTFSSYPLRLAKIAFTPEDFHKIWVYPWRIGSYPWRIWVYPCRILWKLRLHPQRVPYFFTLPLTKSSIFITYPWRISWFLNRARADIKCNSPFASQLTAAFPFSRRTSSNNNTLYLKRAARNSYRN